MTIYPIELDIVGVLDLDVISNRASLSVDYDLSFVVDDSRSSKTRALLTKLQRQYRF